MNKHIEKYLDLYLEREDVEYATLLTGEWGCGKTFFIKNYIEKKSKKDEHKFIYVSLFGLKDISSVKDAIFDKLHPILANKEIKFLGGVLKSAIKLGLKVDLAGDGEKETNIKIDFNKLNIPDDSKYKDTIFIFDDLERTLIPITEILGFIHSIFENKNVKTIIISNEEEIKNDNLETYNKFKEKLIGKSFKIKAEKNYWNYFEDKYKSIFEKNKKQIYLVMNIFEKFGNNNYRNINQCTDDYINFISEIDKDLLKNHKFSDILIEQFYTLSLEHKKNNNIETHLNSLENNEYNIFPKETWIDIICNSSVDYESLNKSIPKLFIFNKTKEKSWERLRYYRKLNYTEFIKNLKDVESKFIGMNYNDIDILRMVVNELIFFVKNNLCTTLSINNIEEKVKEYIDKFNENHEILDFEHLAFNHTGLRYIDENDDDFKRIEGLLYDEYIKIKTNRDKQKLINNFYSLLPSIKVADWSLFDEEYSKYKETDLLRKEDAEKIINLLNENGDYSGLYNLFTFLNKRYSITEIMLKENNFIYEFVCCLKAKLQKEENVFYKLKLNEILVKFQQMEEKLRKIEATEATIEAKNKAISENII